MEERLSKLERDHRRSRRGALGALALLAVVLLGAQADAPSAATGQRVIIGNTTIDPSGITVAAGGKSSANIYLGENDDPTISERDTAGTVRILSGVNKNGDPLLYEYDAQGTLRLSVFEDTASGTRFRIYGANGKVFGAMYQAADTAVGQIDLEGSDAKDRVSMTGTDAGGYLSIYDGNGQRRVFFGLFSGGGFGGIVRNASGGQVWTAP